MQVCWDLLSTLRDDWFLTTVSISFGLSVLNFVLIDERRQKLQLDAVRVKFFIISFRYSRHWTAVGTVML
jgi:hypothetical protein